MNAKLAWRARVAAVLVVLSPIAGWPGRPEVLRGIQAIQSPDLDSALRASDLQRARRLVPGNWAAAEALFVSYLERAFLVPNPGRGKPDAATLAGRLAEVFFRIVEYDFAPAVVSTMEQADLARRQQLIAAVRDYYSALERLRLTYASSESGPGGASIASERKVLSKQLTEIADRFRAISFPRGELIVLRSMVDIPGAESAARADRLADQLGDELSLVRKRPYTEASLATAERLGLPRLQISILTDLGLGIALSRPDATADKLEQAANYLERARALARGLPVLETVNFWLWRAQAPRTATTLANLWLVYQRLQRSGEARRVLAEALEISRPFGENAVLYTLSQFANRAVPLGSDVADTLVEDSRAYGEKAQLSMLRQVTRSGASFRPDLAEKALAMAVALPDPHERAVTLEWYSRARLGLLSAAQRAADFRPDVHVAFPAIYQELLELCLESGELELTADALANQGETLAIGGRPTLSTEAYKRAIDLAQRSENWLKAAQIANRAADFRTGRPSDTARYEMASLAAEAANKAGSSLELARALRMRARTVEEMQQAVAAAERCTEQTGNPEEELRSLESLATLCFDRGDYQAAVDTSLRQADRARDKRPPANRYEPQAFEKIAWIYASIGEPQLARAAAERLRRSLETTISDAERLARAPDLWRSYESLGRIAAALGEPVAAMDYWGKGLKKIAEAAPSNSAQLARRSILQERATFYAQLGDYEASLKDWEDVLPLLAPTFRNYSMSEASQKSTWMAAVAWTHALAGNLDKALALAREAVAELKKDTSGQRAQELINGLSADDRIVEILLLTNHPEEAIAFCNFREEQGRREPVNDVFFRAVLERDRLVDLARAYLKAGQTDRARSSLMSASDVHRTLPATSPSWTSVGGSPLLALGTLELGAGNDLVAKQHLLAARDEVNPYDADRIWQIERALGLALARTGDGAGGAAHYENALTALESVHERLRPEESRLKYGFDRSRLYDEYASLLAARASASGRQADAEAAFQAVERKRTETLWGLLATGWSRVPPEAMPDQVRRSLEMDTRLAAKQRILREQFDQPSEKRDTALIEKLRKDLTQIRSEHARLLGSIAQGQYRYAASANLAASLASPVRSALGPSRILVEYLVTDQRSYAFVVSQAGITVVPLAIGRESLRQQVQRLLLPFRQLRAGKVDLARLSYDTRAAYRLYRAVFAPIQAMLGSASQLIIVPDDVLNVLPFEALVERMPQAVAHGTVMHGAFADAAFLLRRFAIGYLSSSAQLLVAPVEPGAGQGVKRLFAMANPTAGPSTPLAVHGDPLVRALRSTRFDGLFVPIPETEIEIGRIAQYFPKDTATLVTGTKATEAAYQSQAGRYDIVHFATHGVASDGQPLYSTLILSPDAASGDDGFLQAYEVLRTPLRAELVALSGCETALGTEDWGQGLLGLVAAFEQAGAKSVLATLWSIDQSAAEVMGGFYRAMARGTSPSVALRQAKLQLLQQRVRMGSVDVSLAHPFFWAPFKLVGVGWSLQADGVRPARKAP